MEIELMTYSLVDQLRLPDVTVPKTDNVDKMIDTDTIEGDWFIRGPILGSWIGKAAHLGGGHTFHVALAIHYVSGLHRNSRKVTLERFHLDRFGVKKDSARRALDRLREAGLIEYTKVGQKYKVTVILQKS